MVAWNVYKLRREVGWVEGLSGKFYGETVYRDLIDTVFFDKTMDASEVYRSLINHDGYDPSILVRKQSKVTC